MEISAKVLARSKSAITGKEIVTFELVYPRMILAELNTHRILSKNSASSRAIPIAKVIESVRTDPAMPVHWGKNQPGMSAREELDQGAKEAVQVLWQLAALSVADTAERMDALGAHKQVANRILEPFQWMKTVLTGTEFDNFFHLRNHADADPNIKALAKAMWDALQEAPVVTLQPGDWHMPYFGDGYWLQGCGIPLEDALAISSSCAAQTSFRTTDDSLEKAHRIFDRLVESKPVHASPFEHQATPMQAYRAWDDEHPWHEGVNTPRPSTWEKGVTAMDRKSRLWSGNFCEWIQHRQLIPDNACWDYKEHA